MPTRPTFPFATTAPCHNKDLGKERQARPSRHGHVARAFVGLRDRKWRRCLVRRPRATCRRPGWVTSRPLPLSALPLLRSLRCLRQKKSSFFNRLHPWSNFPLPSVSSAHFASTCPLTSQPLNPSNISSLSCFPLSPCSLGFSAPFVVNSPSPVASARKAGK